jgi:hypothetical protein
MEVSHSHISQNIECTNLLSQIWSRKLNSSFILVCKRDVMLSRRVAMTLMMGAETISETLTLFNELTYLIARGDFINVYKWKVNVRTVKFLSCYFNPLNRSLSL